MKRVKLVVAYDGTNYCGWQIQINGITIEEVLNKALSDLLKEPVAVIGASRTDSGVHAEGNVAVFDTENRMPADKICFALNQRLPEDIRVLSSEEVNSHWHPRRQNCIKTYEYRILNRKIDMPTRRLYSHFCYFPLDVEKMRAGASCLVGEHDFKSFCTVRGQAEETVRTIYSLDVDLQEDMITIRISGSGFLYNMVRIVAGTLMKVGMGVYPPEHVKEIMDARDRMAAGPKAPARGLTLVSLEYEKELEQVIRGENQYWKYQLIQKEIVPKEKAYIIIERCVPEEYDRLLARITHRAVRNGAKYIYVHDRESEERIEPGKSYGYYTFRHVYDMVQMTKPVKPASQQSSGPGAATGRITCLPLVKEKIPEYCQLYNQIFFHVPSSGTLTQEELETDFQKTEVHNCFLMAGRETAGFVRLVTQAAGILEIDGVGLLEEYRGRGLGTDVFAKIEEYGAANQVRMLQLLVATANTAAYSLYKRLGFGSEIRKACWYMAKNQEGKTSNT